MYCSVDDWDKFFSEYFRNLSSMNSVSVFIVAYMYMYVKLFISMYREIIFSLLWQDCMAESNSINEIHIFLKIQCILHVYIFCRRVCDDDT